MLNQNHPCNVNMNVEWWEAIFAHTHKHSTAKWTSKCEWVSVSEWRSNDRRDIENHAHCWFKTDKNKSHTQRSYEMVCASECQRSKRARFFDVKLQQHQRQLMWNWPLPTMELCQFTKKAVRRKLAVHRQCKWCLSARPWDARLFANSSFVQNWNTTH